VDQHHDDERDQIDDHTNGDVRHARAWWMGLQTKPGHVLSHHPVESPPGRSAFRPNFGRQTAVRNAAVTTKLLLISAAFLGASGYRGAPRASGVWRVVHRAARVPGRPSRAAPCG